MKLLNLDFELSDSDNGFDANQIADIGNFLSSEPIRPLLALLAIESLTETSDDSDKKFDAGIKSAFVNEARKWTSVKSDSWIRNVDAVWDRLVELHQEILPAVSSDSGWADDISYFYDFVNTPLRRENNGPGNYQTRFVAQLVKLSSDIERLRAAFDASVDIAQQIAAAGLDPIITHTDIGAGKSADFESLYINRTFVDISDGGSLDSSVLSSGNTPFRLVVTGAPGAGKTTYLHHFRRQFCHTQRRPVLVVRCREYAATNWDRSNLVDFTVDRYNAEYSDEIEHSTIRDVLTLGRAVVVFDGLDEVTDPLRRIELARRINAFGSMFPLASILVTSREVGYDRAPVDARIFARVQLKEFELEQALAYVRKWFTLVDQSELIDRFIHDSESIPDLRLNPLMLSLLCLLYRESGAIPSGRLGIYSECARLLFHRWDNHRQIKVDGAIPDFSDILMQEIARWFYTSPTAQAGLDETVIRGMLKRILIDQSGFPDGRADEAAADFLEFCAGRAWLLGATGSNHRGERLFSFTHKTFSEYFAAESFARNSESVSDVCKRIVQVFEDDSSSVLPELLIQSYAKHSAQGAIRVIKELHNSATPLLLLRLIEGASLPAHSRKLVFESVVSDWRQDRLHKWEEFLSLLQLNPLARDQFAQEYLLVDRKIREVFLSGWASVVLYGMSDRYLPSWGELVRELMEMSDIDELATRDEAIWNWNALGCELAPMPGNRYLTLVCEGAFGFAPGASWYAVQQSLRFRKPLNNSAACLCYVAELVSALNDGHQIPVNVLSQVRTVVLNSGADAGWAVRWVTEADQGVCLDLYAYISLALYERFGGYRNTPHAISALWSGVLREVVDINASGAQAEPPDEETLKSANKVLSFLPSRLGRWMIGGSELVREEPLEHWW